MWCVVLGILSTATMPVAVGATRYSAALDLLQAGFAIPVGLLLGAAAVVLARRAGERAALTLGRAGGYGAARAGRLLGIVGICIACSALVALAVYGVLTYVGGQ